MRRIEHRHDVVAIRVIMMGVFAIGVSVLAIDMCACVIATVLRMCFTAFQELS